MAKIHFLLENLNTRASFRTTRKEISDQKTEFSETPAECRRSVSNQTILTTVSKMAQTSSNKLN